MEEETKSPVDVPTLEHKRAPLHPPDKITLLHLADGPESLEIYTSEYEGVADWCSSLPALYLVANVQGAYVKLGPFYCSKIRDGLMEKLGSKDEGPKNTDPPSLYLVDKEKGVCTKLGTVSSFKIKG